VTVDVQIAFQGGGAKLVNLLAVAEALEEAHDAGRIRITRIAGTSAGAIVASILASGVGVANARRSLDTREMRDAANTLSRETSLWDLLGLLRGKPLRSMTPVTEWLAKLLIGKDAHVSDKSISDICSMRSKNQMELLIVSSDLTNRGSHLADSKDSAVKAVEASSGIPFAFRTWKGTGYERVDGGLCSNLPVDFLRDRESVLGDVLAVSFQKPVTQKHDSFLKYLAVLVDTAISSGESRARESLPKSNVFQISTDLTTYDFTRAIEHGIGEQYRRIKSEAQQWLDDFIDLKNHDNEMLGIDPWVDQSANSKYSLAQMGEYFSALEGGRSIVYEKARLTISAPSLSTPANVNVGTSDYMRLELTFRAGENPVNMMSLSVADIDEATSLDARSLRCKVRNQNGDSLPTTFIPMSLPKAPFERHVAVCFHDPLPPNSGPYTLDYFVRGSRLLRTLQVKGEDIVAYFPTSTTGTVGTIELVVLIPTGANVSRKFVGEAEEKRWLASDELPHEHQAGLIPFGCVGSSVPVGGGNDFWRLQLTLGESRAVA